MCSEQCEWGPPGRIGPIVNQPRFVHLDKVKLTPLAKVAEIVENNFEPENVQTTVVRAVNGVDMVNVKEKANVKLAIQRKDRCSVAETVEPNFKRKPASSLAAGETGARKVHVKAKVLANRGW